VLNLIETTYETNGKYFGGSESKSLAKAWRAGWLNQASDFANSSQDALNKRSFGERLMMFGFAGAASMIAGAGEEKIKKINNSYLRGATRGLRQIASGYFDYHMQQTAHSTFKNNPEYMPWKYKYRYTKLSITGYKALFYGLNINKP
jgi:hypothetical protein